MDDYCDPMQDPTAGFHDYLEPLSTTSDYPSSTKFFDPPGFSKTEVFLYVEQPSMTAIEACSTSLSTIEHWFNVSIETILSEEQADITPASDDDDSRYTTSSNSITSVTFTSGTPTKVSKSSDSTSNTVVYPPIIIQPAYPTSTAKPLPPASLVTKTGASDIIRVGCGGIFGILSLVAVLIML
jgi:hypothetical protein